MLRGNVVETLVFLTCKQPAKKQQNTVLGDHYNEYTVDTLRHGIVHLKRSSVHNISPISAYEIRVKEH